MIKEWKRMFLNRSVLIVAMLLLVLNLGLFALSFVDIGDYFNYRAMVNDRETLFAYLEAGTITSREIAAEMEQLGVIQQFYTYENMKQNYPDVYEIAYAQSDREARNAYPDIATAFVAGEYDQQEVGYRSSVLSAVLSSVGYTTEFYEKLDEVFENAEVLSNISIFQNSNEQDSNLTKTVDDYLRLSDIQVTAGNDAPINALVTYDIPGIFCMLFACVVVSQTLVENQYNLRTLIYATKRGRGKLTLWRGMGLLTGSGIFGFLLYGSTIGASCALLGTVDAARMVQSIPALFGLTVPMTIGEFMMLYLICGIGVQVMLIALVWALFSLLEQRQMALLAVAGVVGLSVLLYQVIPAQSFLAVLKYTNIVAVMNITSSVTTYRNLGVGSLLIEKTTLILIATVAVTIVCSVCAGCCGVKCYSISRHGKFYNTVQCWLKKLSQRYHRMISRLTFGILEGYKVLIMQRGVLVLILATTIFIRAYPTREITYIGEAQFLLEFYEEFAGEGVTPELVVYVDSLQQTLEDVEMEFTDSQLAFQNGEIGMEEYLTQSQKYIAYDVQRSALEKVRTMIAFVTEQEILGYEAVVMDSTGYAKLLETSALDRSMHLICLFAVVLISGLIFPLDQKQGLHQMIRSTAKGRTYLAKKKLCLALALSFLLFSLYTGIRTYSVAATYGLANLTAPAHSLSWFSSSSMNLDIWVTFVLYWFAQWVVFAVAAVFVCLLTQVLPQQIALLMGTALGIGTAVLDLLGFRLPTIWDALEKVTACVFTGEWIYLIITVLLLVVAWLATVDLWGNLRRRKK